MSESGLVSRVSLVHTALRNCTRDREVLRGRQSGVDLKPPQAAVVKSDGGERCGKVGTGFRQARLREASASEPLQKCRNRSKYPPAEPGALGLEPLEAADPCCINPHSYSHCAMPPQEPSVLLGHPYLTFW